MTISTAQPGSSETAADGVIYGSPYTPIGYVGDTPIYGIGGGRSSSGITFAVGDDNGSDPSFGDDDDDDDDPDDDDDRDDDDDDDDDEAPAARRTTTRRTRDDEPAADDDWEPPSREAFDRMQDAMKKANNTAAKHRRAGKTMEKLGITDLPSWLAERGIDPDNGLTYGNDVVDPVGADDEPEPQLDEYGYEYEQPAAKPTRQRDGSSDREIARSILAAEKRAEEKARQTYVPILAQQQAEMSLRDAGFRGSREKLDLALRLIDPKQLDVEITDDGYEIDGLDEQVELIREQLPELFRQDEAPRRERAAARSTRRTGARDVDGGERGRQPAQPKGWKEQVAEQMMNRGRR